MGCYDDIVRDVCRGATLREALKKVHPEAKEWRLWKIWQYCERHYPLLLRAIKIRKAYFKDRVRQAVRLVREDGWTISKAAKYCGVSCDTLSHNIGHVAPLKEDESLNTAREIAGLGKIEERERVCLRCGRKFMTTSKFNRLCPYCTGEIADVNYSVYTLHI